MPLCVCIAVILCDWKGRLIDGLPQFYKLKQWPFDLLVLWQRLGTCWALRSRETTKKLVSLWFLFPYLWKLPPNKEILLCHFSSFCFKRKTFLLILYSATLRSNLVTGEIAFLRCPTNHAWKCAPLIFDIRKMASESEFSFSWWPRKANEAANWLAKILTNCFLPKLFGYPILLGIFLCVR